MDMIVRDVDVLDGSGASAYRADLGLRGDRFVEIGDLSAVTVIDGKGPCRIPWGCP